MQAHTHPAEINGQSAVQWLEIKLDGDTYRARFEDVAGGGEKDVFRLQICVYNANTVQDWEQYVCQHPQNGAKSQNEAQSKTLLTSESTAKLT